MSLDWVLWLWLSWTLLRDRWVIKAIALRFMTYLLLALYWSVEFEISTLLFYTLVVELNWYLAERYKRKDWCFRCCTAAH